MNRFTITNESVTVILEDGKSHTVQEGAANFGTLRAAVLAGDWETVKTNLTPAKKVIAWAKGDFTVEGETVSYKGAALPSELNVRILAMAAEDKDPKALCAFWERLSLNPSWRSTQQLFRFLSHLGIPITEDGCFLAYKAITGSNKDVHTGTIDNSPGTVHKMPRNQISDDPKEACHFGFHVGALRYAQGFCPPGGKMVICKVDPANVVCVPYDSNNEKMRVCEYEVIGYHGMSLPDTAITLKELELPRQKTAPVSSDETDYEDEDDEDEDDDENWDMAAKPKAVRKAKASVPPKPKETEPKFQDELADLGSLDETGLLACDLGTLRKYAANVLKIVGASKILGGKTALVARILEVR